MRKLISHFQLTLDGFMSGPNGELDWSGDFHDDAMWEETIALLNTVDTVLFGRITYQLFEAYWPAVPANPSSTQYELDFSGWIDKTPKVVISTTLKSAEWKNTTLLSANIEQEINKLKARSGKNLLIFGSSSLVSSLFKHGLIDEFRINVHPVIIGKGKPFLKDVQDQNKLSLIKVKAINAGAIGIEYEVGRK